MTTFLLSLLVLNWLFYTVCSGLILWTYYLVKDGDDDCMVGGYVLSGLALAWALYYFDGLRAVAFSWPSGAYLVFGYLGAGFVVMGIKWLMTLIEFKHRAIEWIKVHPKESMEPNVASQMSYDFYQDSYTNKITRDENGTVRLNHRAFPLSNWVVFWPLFTVSIGLDKAVESIKWIIKRLSSALDWVAKRFSVKITP